MEYIAVYEEANVSVSMTKDTQMDEHLARGAKIYSVEGEKNTLIATPNDGFLTERPVFPVAKTIRIGSSSELEKAARIMLGMEE